MLPILAGSILLAAAAATDAFEQVVAAERAFAAASPDVGFHAAFVAHFAEDGVVFTPVPTNGRKAHDGKPRAAGTLSWEPAWVAAPASADLAFSSGPWEFRVPGENAPAPGTGWFFTAWRKQPDGRWLVEADLGIDAPLAYAVTRRVEDGLAGANPSRPIRPGDAAAARAKIAAAERSLSKAGRSGIGAAVGGVADPLLRVYRTGSLPATGASAAPLLAADGRKAECVAERVAAAGSGDLGYAYGTCTPTDGGAEAKRYGYLRVWRRQSGGSWRVFVDVTP